MAIRTYALYGCSRRMLAWMSIIIAALVAVACVRFCINFGLWSLLIISRPSLLYKFQWMLQSCRESAAMKFIQQRRTSFSSLFCVPAQKLLQIRPSVNFRFHFMLLDITTSSNSRNWAGRGGPVCL